MEVDTISSAGQTYRTRSARCSTAQFSASMTHAQHRDHQQQLTLCSLPPYETIRDRLQYDCDIFIHAQARKYDGVEPRIVNQMMNKESTVSVSVNKYCIFNIGKVICDTSTDIKCGRPITSCTQYTRLGSCNDFRSVSVIVCQDIKLIEGVQRRATKLVTGMKELSYNDRLKQCLQQLEGRRMRSDLIETFKIVHRKYDINPELFLS